jgi:hypothetical protein
MQLLLRKYEADIDSFADLVAAARSSADLLARIRSPNVDKDTRMSLLKIFRRCVAPVLDTEMTKKITKVSTDDLVSNYGEFFKPIKVLKQQFTGMDTITKGALSVLIGEYDARGQVGYLLTDRFFNWVAERFQGRITIEGPRGAGRDIELSKVFPDFKGDYPCDFVLRDAKSKRVLAVGFARYDSTRGGAQSDDRTGGNANKVSKAREFCSVSGNRFKIIFVADGPGLVHGDTWKEACTIDGDCDDNVRVTTLKLANMRITPEWLLS